MIYLDSSVLLEIYFGRSRADEARAVLGEGHTLSSWLTAIEVPIVLRRAIGGHRRHARRLPRLLERFDADIAAIALVDEIPEVARRVRRDARLAGCRSLDAIHVATAIVAQEASGSPIRVATFDRPLGAAAAALGLKLAFRLGASHE